ncbi:MAG: LysR family transcriptional regulator [Thiopseudomonas sp.]|nr:LysR family transcriptional regulator [Thiopseudomonas sp.]
MKDIAQLPSLNALRAFVAVANEGSINAAAQQLHVTHGAVSRQIKLLEGELGTALLEKQGRGIKLTHAGQQLYHGCLPAFQAIADSCRQLSQQQQDKPLVLACSGSILARWLIPRLQQLQQALPDLNLQLITSAGDDNPQQQADLSLTFIDHPQASELLIPLEQERIGPIMAPQLAFIDPARLPEQKLLHTQSRPQAWPQWAQRNRLDAQNLTMGQGFPHLSHLLEAVTAGLGTGIAPELLIRTDLQLQRLVAPLGFVPTGSWLCLQIHQPQQLQRIRPLIAELQNSADT